MAALIRIQTQSYKIYSKKQTCLPPNVNRPFYVNYGKNVTLLSLCRYVIMS